jgi:hypothetical protein
MCCARRSAGEKSALGQRLQPRVGQEWIGKIGHVAGMFAGDGHEPRRERLLPAKCKGCDICIDAL